MLKIHKKKQAASYVIALQGQLVTGETAILRDAVLKDTDAVSLVLDFSRVSRIDASGLGLLLELREYAQSKRIDLRLINVPGMVRRVFEISQLDCVFDILPERVETFAPFERQLPTGLRLASCH